MPATQPPTIGDAVMFEFITASAYALLIVLGTGQPETLFGASVESWIDLSTPTVQILFALVPVPDGAAGGAHSDTVWIYRLPGSPNASVPAAVRRGAAGGRRLIPHIFIVSGT